MGSAEGFMVCMQAKCRSDWLGRGLAWLLLCRDWRLSSFQMEGCADGQQEKVLKNENFMASTK